MDRAIYVAMSGANQVWQAQQLNANNLANVDTPGFKADLAMYTPVEAKGPLFHTRVNTALTGTRVDWEQGSLMQTEGELDIALQGDGFLVVQGLDGTEQYTRQGALRLDSNGFLTTANGLLVQGLGGPINIPAAKHINIAQDGTVSYLPQNATDGQLVTVGQLRLVKPNNPAAFEKIGNGLYANLGSELIPATDTQINQGFLESSNVNAVAAITDMIALARQYEFQIKMMHTIERNDAASNTLLDLNR